MENELIEIIAFYEFKDLGDADSLARIKADLSDAMELTGVKGTIIIASEGFNAMLCGTSEAVALFVSSAEIIFDAKIVPKSSFYEVPPFRRTEVRIKSEIVTLKKDVDLSLAAGTHITPENWNEIISQPDTIILDTRNDYEFKTGTFRGAINPEIEKFNELPDYIAEHFDPQQHKRIAMFCTGGIRCEKFAPYMKQLGFEEVFQLDGGILNYLESVPKDDSLWEGECFVFDERISVDAELKKGKITDHSQRVSSRKKEQYKIS